MRRRTVSNLLGLVILAGLLPKPLHPYELARTLREWNKDEDIGFRWGSFYTVIGNLAKHGFIEPLGSERVGARPERTVYQLTPAGRDELLDWVGELLSEPARERPRFVAGLSVMSVLPPDEAVEMLRVRQLQLGREVVSRRAELDTYARTVPRIFLIEDEFQLTQLESEIAWVDALINDIVSGTFPGLDEWESAHASGRLGSAPATPEEGS